MKKKFTFYPMSVEFIKKKWLTVLLLTIISGSQSYASAFTSKDIVKAKRAIPSPNLKPNSFAGNRVISFTLINANTNGEIQKLVNGATINLANLPTRNLSVRADTDPSKVGSVVFKLSGAQSHTQLQTDKPYALFGDIKGDYHSWVPTNGNYTLKCTPYSGANGSGTAGTSLTINFQVISQTSSGFISNIQSYTGNGYSLSTLTNGISFYTDRSYQVTSVPASLRNQALIKTPNDDKYFTGTRAVTFKVSQNATVYVAYDPVATQLPAWLNGWQKLSERIGINDPRISYLQVYSKTFQAGTITLGGNLASPAIGSKNTYIVVVKPGGTPNLRPYVTAVRPSDGATNVSLDQSISVDLKYPGGNAIDGKSVNINTVRLYTVSSSGTKTRVSGTAVNSSAAGDAITLSASLKARTTYEFQITNGVKDDKGHTLIPFTSRFKTTNNTTDPTDDLSGVSFTEQTLITTSFGSDGFTSLVIGPDRRLYATTSGGKIERWDIKTDGTITNHKTISPFGSSRRLLIGLRFAPSATSSNLIAWISHSSPVFINAPDWTSKISRINLNNPASPQVIDYVINLPRSYKDHSSNSIDFGPDGALYFTQGSNSAMGLLDGAWGNRPERLLNAAVLRLDISKAQQQGLPIDVKTQEGGTYNPYASGAPLTIYATGIRNAYDFVWHSNGSLYVPINGSAAGGNTPALSSGSKWSNGQTFSGATILAMTDVRQTMGDYLFRVVKGGYYGHPNPLRNEYILNGGNPTSNTDPGEVVGYPVGTPKEPNYREYIYNFGLNISPTGTIEYKSNAFGGKLKGKMLVCRFSGGDDLIVLAPSRSNPNSITATEGITIPGFRRPFSNPLDVIEDVKTGNLYLSEYYDGNGDGQPRITLLKADKPATSNSVAAQRIATFEETYTEPAEESGLTVSVYPNPNPGDNLHTEVRNFSAQERVTLTLHNAVGQVIQTTTLITDEQGTGRQNMTLGKEMLQGIYIIKASGISGNTQTKLVIE
ncbi:MAG: Ig-like domain-containing protein [Bacteroidota bacterium]|nr:Ig-like domain-containing protein [Bacteroidota bacterium]